MKFRIVFFIAFALFAANARAQEATPFVPGNSASVSPALSADGRYVAFTSDASNLISGDSNGTSDIFVHDRVTGETTRVSVASDGTQSDDYSRSPDISSDGRYVVFESMAGNLVKNDENKNQDIFVHDRETGETTRVSVTSDGTEGDLASLSPRISGDGGAVIFWSLAGNLSDDDGNSYADVFVHSLETGETTRVSVASDGTPANDDSFNADISADGRIAVFWSRASNLVLDDTNRMQDIFVHNLDSGETQRVNIASDGTQANGFTFGDLSISGDGRYVAFQSQAANLVSDDTDDHNDIFVHDRQTGQTTRVSVASGGLQSDCSAFCVGASQPSLSADGLLIVFTSDLTGLVDGDTNGKSDIFLGDLAAHSTVRVSVNGSGRQLNAHSMASTISANGREVAFETDAALVLTDFNFTSDIYVYDRETGAATLVSVGNITS